MSRPRIHEINHINISPAASRKISRQAASQRPAWRYDKQLAKGVMRDKTR